MTDTAKKKAAEPQAPLALRDKPKRERKDLSESEMRQLKVHLWRHPGRPTSWLSELTWVAPELIEELRNPDGASNVSPG